MVSLAVMLPTGFLLFMASAVKCYYLPAFWVKMAALAAALAFTFTIRRRVAAAGLASNSARTVALVSLLLWGTVAVAGRLVGFP